MCVADSTFFMYTFSALIFCYLPWHVECPGPKYTLVILFFLCSIILAMFYENMDRSLESADDSTSDDNNILLNQLLLYFLGHTYLSFLQHTLLYYLTLSNRPISSKIIFIVS